MQKKPNMVFHFDAASGSYRVDDQGGYLTRNPNTARLVADAMASFGVGGPRLQRDMHIPIYTVDQSPRVADIHFAYAGDGTEPWSLLIPDFSFSGWPECGWPDYQGTADAMVEAGRSEAKDPRLLWIGNMSTHSTRRTLVRDIARHDKRLHAMNLEWLNAPGAGKMHDIPKGSRYITLPEHCQYRYLLDLQGVGYSARLKMLLFSGRPIFIQERRWVEYWHTGLKPFVHFVPVREDLADLSSQLDWADAHPEDIAAIGHNGQQFASDNLQYRHAVKRMVECLIAADNCRPEC